MNIILSSGPLLFPISNFPIVSDTSVIRTLRIGEMDLVPAASLSGGHALRQWARAAEQGVPPKGARLFRFGYILLVLLVCIPVERSGPSTSVHQHREKGVMMRRPFPA